MKSYSDESAKYLPHLRMYNLNDGVSEKRQLKESAIKVYGYIDCWRRDKLACKVGMIKISKLCALSRSTVQLAVKQLELLGWINVIHGAKIERTKNSCNIYTIKRLPKSLRMGKKVQLPSDLKLDKSGKIEKTESEKQRSKLALLHKALNNFDVSAELKHEIIKKIWNQSSAKFS